MLSKIDSLENALAKLIGMKDKEGHSESYYQEMNQRIEDIKELLEKAYEEEYGR